MLHVTKVLKQYTDKTGRHNKLHYIRGKRKKNTFVKPAVLISKSKNKLNEPQDQEEATGTSQYNLYAEGILKKS